MGQAKRRGTYEERKADSIARNGGIMLAGKVWVKRREAMEYKNRLGIVGCSTDGPFVYKRVR